MRGMFSYSGIATKTRAMSGKLLTGRQPVIRIISQIGCRLQCIIPDSVGILIKKEKARRQKYQQGSCRILHIGM